MFAYVCTCAYLYTFICVHVGEDVGMSVYVCEILWICGTRMVVCMCVHVSVCVALCMGECVSLCSVGSWAVDLGASTLLLTDGPANEALPATCLIVPTPWFPFSSPAAGPVAASALPCSL